jgi:hypothetical protein
MFSARFQHGRRRRKPVSGTVCTTTGTTTSTTVLLLCIAFHAFTRATAVPGKPAFTHIQHTDNDSQLLLNIEPPSGDATNATDFYYNVAVQRKIPIPKWTLDLSATGGKKEFNSSSSPLFIANNSNFEILNEAGFRIRVITAPNTLVDGDEAWSTGTLGHSFLPLQFGKGSGGLDVRGSANAIELKVRNDPFFICATSCAIWLYRQRELHRYVLRVLRTSVCSGLTYGSEALRRRKIWLWIPQLSFARMFE